MTKNTKNKFYFWLDPIRAVAALLVLFVHARSVMFCLYKDLIPTSQNIFSMLFFTICSLGGFAVGTFYILSGFLVGGKTIEKARSGNASPLKFCLDRLFRIGVPLTGALILIVIVNYFLNIPIEPIQLFGQYTGLQGVIFKDYGGVFWTLAYECWFYIAVFAFLIICCRKKYLLGGMFILILSFLVISNLQISWFCPIVYGIVAFYMKDYKLKKSLRLFLWILFIIDFIFYIFSSNNYFVSTYLQNGLNFKIAKFNIITLFGILSVIISQYVYSIPKWGVSKFCNKYGKKLASFSYSLFLTHYQILKIWIAKGPKFDHVNLTSIFYFILVCLFCIGFAYIFYLIFEKNTLKIQKSFTSLIFKQRN